MAEDLLIHDDNESPVRLEELLSGSGLAHQEVMELGQFGVFQMAGGLKGTFARERFLVDGRWPVT